MQKTNEELRGKLESGQSSGNAQARLRDREGYITSLQVIVHFISTQLHWAFSLNQIYIMNWTGIPGNCTS